MSIKRLTKSLILCSSFCFIANYALAEEKPNTPDYQKKIKELTSKAENEDTKAQYKLGLMYKNGKGVKQNYNKAIKWLHNPAFLNYKDTQFIIGSMYENGEGVKKDLNEACGWYTLSCENKHTLGCKAKSKLEEKGIKATFNFLNDNDPWSFGKVTLGLMYKNGKGVKQNYNKAMSLLREAAPEQPYAQFIIGSMYENGEGVKKDLNEACGWYTYACGHEYDVRGNNNGKYCKARYRLEKKGIKVSQKFFKNGGPMP